MSQGSIKQDQTRDTSRINGVTKHCMTQPSITVDNVVYTPTQVIQIYQSDLDAEAAVAAARSMLATAMAKAKPARAAAALFDKGFKPCIVGAYGSSPAIMTDFGITIATPKVKTAAQKAAANLKAKATRAARHTMGSAQKAAIKPVQLTVSVTTLPDSSAASAPAATTPSGAATPAIVAKQ